MSALRTFRRRLPSLPLLAKELIEQAANRRTYAVRSAYAVLLLVTAWLLFYQILSTHTGTTSFQVLGQGQRMFQTMLSLQLAGIYLFMPAITCGVVTREQERGTLALLCITRLGPGTILLEKLASRLVPMFTFLLLALPLSAFAYSLGGVSQGELWFGIWLLALAAVQVGSITVMCSAYFRSTTKAFIGSYLCVAALSFWCGPLGVFFILPGRGSVEMNAFSTIVTLGVSGYCLVRARHFLSQRIFGPPRDVVRDVLYDAGYSPPTNLEESLTRGISRRPVDLPDDRPVAWRERAKVSLGPTGMYLRLFVFMVEIIILLICFVTWIDLSVSWSHFHSVRRVEYSPSALPAILFLLWFVTVPIIVANSVNLVAIERSRQTLDVLLHTPLTGREILEQKLSGVNWVSRMLRIPLVTVVLAETFFWTASGRFENATLYLIFSLLSIVVYPPFLAWLSMTIGLRRRSQVEAIVGALGAVVCWCVAPIILLYLLEMLEMANRDLMDFVYHFSPIVAVGFNEVNESRIVEVSAWIGVFSNFAACGFVCFILRTYCLRNADRLLRESHKAR